jgi:ABC-type polysaccharide/polyol phosphate export permease
VTLPIGLKGIVYLLPLTYTSTGLRAVAYLPLSQFPWYSIPILLGCAIALSLLGAYQFAHQQDEVLLAINFYHKAKKIVTKHEEQQNLW